MSNWRAMAVATTAVCVLLAVSVFTAGPTFRADYRFTGTALTGFKPIGQADWKVQNGEIVGTPKDANGGWLLARRQGISGHADVREREVRRAAARPGS